MSKYSVGLKALLQESLSEPELYGDLVCKFRKVVDKTDFSVQCRKIVTSYKKIGYNMDILQLIARIIVNPIMVDNYGTLFNSTTVDQSSD